MQGYRLVSHNALCPDALSRCLPSTAAWLCIVLMVVQAMTGVSCNLQHCNLAPVHPNQYDINMGSASRIIS